MEQALEEVLGQLLPGLPLPADMWDVVADRVGSLAHWPSDVFLVPRDDLPEGEALGEALAGAYGAEPGDRVLEVGMTQGRASARSWVLAQADVPSNATAP